jgi:hypothetical protein
LLLCRYGLRRLPQEERLTAEEALPGVKEIFAQMPAVGDLSSGRSALSSTVGIGPRAIPTDNLDPRMRAQPLRHCRGFAIGEHINWAAPLEIHHERPVTTAFLERPVVDADDTGRWCCGQGHPPHLS